MPRRRSPRRSPRRKRSRRSMSQTRRGSPKRSSRRRRYRAGRVLSSSPLRDTFTRKDSQRSQQTRKAVMAAGATNDPLPPAISDDIAATVEWTQVKELGAPLIKDTRNVWRILPYTYNDGLIAYKSSTPVDELSGDPPEFVEMYTSTIVAMGGNEPPFHMTPLQTYNPAQYQLLNMSDVYETILDMNDTRNVYLFKTEKLQADWGRVPDFIQEVRSQVTRFTCTLSGETYTLSGFTATQGDEKGENRFPIVFLYRNISTSSIGVVQFAPSQPPPFSESIQLVPPSPTTPTTEPSSRTVSHYPSDEIVQIL